MDRSLASTTLEWNEATRCTAFDGNRRIASGPLREVAAETKAALDQRVERAVVLIFDDATGRQIEVDFRGSVKTVLSRLPKADAPAPDADAATELSAAWPRPPALGSGRPGGDPAAPALEVAQRPARRRSVALRKLVEGARRTSADADRKRRCQEAAYRFATALAGNQAGYEEAMRALFAGDAGAFGKHMARWPADVRDYARQLAREAMGDLP